MEFQQWVSALLQAEEEAVRGESYQIAKRYKYIGDKLERFTKILSDLEIEKRHAVETKDYDEAEKIKVRHVYIYIYILYLLRLTHLFFIFLFIRL